jgi:hypothetical protein
MVYEPSEYQRIIPACLIDSRATISALANKIGSDIKAYCDIEVNKVKNNENVLFFKIETVDLPNTENLKMEDGVLAGYFSLVALGFVKVIMFQRQIRPNFTFLDAQISVEINNFITSGRWRQYVL